eukprot:4202544-Amphidinium_carterae.1
MQTQLQQGSLQKCESELFEYATISGAGKSSVSLGFCIPALGRANQIDKYDTPYLQKSRSLRPTISGMPCRASWAAQHVLAMFP